MSLEKVQMYFVKFHAPLSVPILVRYDNNVHVCVVCITVNCLSVVRCRASISLVTKLQCMEGVVCSDNMYEDLLHWSKHT